MIIQYGVETEICWYSNFI